MSLWPFFEVGEQEHLPKETLEIILLFSLEETKCPKTRENWLYGFCIVSPWLLIWKTLLQAMKCPSAEVLSVYTFLALKNKSVRAGADSSKWGSQDCPIWCPRILWQASTEGLALHQRNTTRKSLSFRIDLKYVEILDCSSLSCHTCPPAGAVTWIITEQMPVLACIKFLPYIAGWGSSPVVCLAGECLHGCQSGQDLRVAKQDRRLYRKSLIISTLI